MLLFSVFFALIFCDGAISNADRQHVSSKHKKIAKKILNVLVFSSILPCDFLVFRGIIIITIQKGELAVYKVGERVVYGVHGVCQIIDLQVQTVNRKKVEYFVLEPIAQPGSSFFVPTQSPAALSKLRPIMTKKQIDELLSSQQSEQSAWIEDENLRKQTYRQMIVEGSCEAMLGMIRALRLHRDEQLAAGKKFHVTDANFLKDAEKIIYSEFSLVLGIGHEQVEAYINQF